MTQLKIGISQEVYSQLVDLAGEREGGPQRFMEDLLKKVLHLDPNEGWFPVSPAIRQQLEGILGGSFSNDQALLDRVKDLSSVKIGQVELFPSKGQLAEITRRAKANNRTPEEELAGTFKLVCAQMLGNY